MCISCITNKPTFPHNLCLRSCFCFPCWSPMCHSNLGSNITPLTTVYHADWWLIQIFQFYVVRAHHIFFTIELKFVNFKFCFLDIPYSLFTNLIVGADTPLVGISHLEQLLVYHTSLINTWCIVEFKTEWVKKKWVNETEVLFNKAIAKIIDIFYPRSAQCDENSGLLKIWL